MKHSYLENNQKYGGYSNEIYSLIGEKKRVLDIGCSTGTLAKLLNHCKYCRVTGVDVDPNSLNRANDYCEKVILCDLDCGEDLANKLGEEKFDVIVCGDILEHLKYPELLLTSLKNSLSKNGILLASIPNSAFVLMRLKFLFGNFNSSAEFYGLARG